MKMNMLNLGVCLKAAALVGIALLAAGCKKDGPTLDDLYQPTTHYERHPIIVTKSGAHAKACGAWPRDVTRTSQNDQYENFGCFQQNNIAAMVANPQDLVRPRAQTPSDPMRRSKVIDQYRNGETTSAAQEDQQKVKISDVAN
ncbi:MAG: CpaD family pilus assembly lipoprotein [Pseudomonadota bacterium]